MSAPLGRWPETGRRMGIGMMMPISDHSTFGGTPRFRDMAEMAQVAESAGYDAIWIADHLIVQTAAEAPIRGVWEGWTTLAALAALTNRITIGVLVTCVGWRNPAIIAKMAENLDEISGGRFVLGLGAGWHRPEYEMFGFAFDHRVSRFEDAVKVIQPLLREGKADYQGQYAEVHDAVNLPRGPRAAEGGPPIMVGTKGPRMMRLTARYADAWNGDWAREAAEIVPMMTELETACREVGRDPRSMVITASSNIGMPGYLGVRLNPITGSNQHIAETVAGFRDLNVRHHVAGLDPCTPRSLEEYARVIELLDRTES